MEDGTSLLSTPLIVTPSYGSPSKSLLVCCESVEQRGSKAGSIGVVGVGGAYCENNKGWRHWPKGRVHSESVHMTVIHLQYTTSSYMYRCG